MHVRSLVSRARRAGERGMAAIGVIILVVLLVGISVTLATSVSADHKERKEAMTRARLRYDAEGIVHEAYARFKVGGKETYRASATAQSTVADVRKIRRTTYGDSDASIADDLLVIEGIASHDGYSSAARLVVRFVPTPPDLLVFSDRTMTIKGNSFVDSFDSDEGTYASQATNTWMGMPRADAGAYPATNQSLTLDSNAAIFGDATAGPAGTVTTSGGSIVTGDRENLTVATPVPTVTVPAIASSGNLDTGGTLTWAPGDYRYGTFRLQSNAHLTIRGPARVVIADMTVDSNARITADVSGGPVEIFLTGPARFLSNAIIQPTSGLAKDLWIRSNSTSEIFIDSNPKLTARILAPRARVAAYSNAAIHGSVVAAEIYLDSNAQIHMDESLQTVVPGQGTFTPLAWRPVSPAQADAIAKSISP